jgi:hypothetical protein
MNIKLLNTRIAPESIRQLLSRMARGRIPAIRVQRQQVPYWRQQGWIRSGGRYNGNYQTAYGAFQGYAEQRGPHFFRFYILHPPDALSRHSHWACFISRGGGSYEIHLARQPADISSGIISIERLLTEAFEQVKRSH